MYTRFLRLKLKPGSWPDFQRFYEDRVLPTLETTAGCLFAGLLRSAGQQDAEKEECISLTLWESRDQADAYEKGGLYYRLLNEAEPYLWDAAEWKVELAKDLTVQYRPAEENPVVEGYSLEAGDETRMGEGEGSPGLYLRIVSVKVEPGRFEELKERYAKEVIPALQAQKGCRSALLLEGIQDRERALSISIWDSEEDAVRYELSGEFERLTEHLRDTLSQLYLWKVSLASPARSGEITSKDLDVTGYHLVAGKKF